MRPTKKPVRSKAKIAPKPAQTRKPSGEAPGPDERRPEVKADEIYGDTKIPKQSRK